MTVSRFSQSTHFATLRNELATLTAWLRTDALPLWSERGVDRDCGGFYEKLTQGGTVVEEPRRTRLVARQIYVFATAGELGWQDNETSHDLMDHGLDFLINNCFTSSGTVHSAVDPRGQPLGSNFDLYDHAFALFGLAACARLGHHRASVVDLALGLVNAMVAGWKHPIAGFEEAMPPREPLNSSSHMHLLEAFLEWEALDDNDFWHRLSDEIADLALSKLMDPATGSIPEHFNHDWSLADGELGRFVEPGHQFEWAWLLWRWGVARNSDNAFQKVRRLTELAEKQGINEHTNLAINGIWDDLSARNRQSRLWPQTERLKANIAVAELSAGKQRELALKQAAEAAAGLRRYFETSVAGLWHETLDDRGLPVPGPAKASSLYHIVGAIRELDLFVNRHDVNG